MNESEAYNALLYMNFSTPPRLYQNETITPLMHNPNVYELHQTTFYDRYQNPINDHMTCRTPRDETLWTHRLG